MSEQDKQPEIKVSKTRYVNYRKRVETILESFTDGFFEVDSKWTVTYWNRTAEQILLKQKKEIIGTNLWESFPDAVSLKFYTEYQRCMVQQTATRFEEYFPPMQRWFEVSVFPNGQGLSVYFKDITESKHIAEQLESERKKYQDLFDHSPLPQWVYDIQNLTFLDVNEAAIEHYGYSRAEFMNMTIKDIRPSEDIPLLEKALEKTKYRRTAHTSFVRHTKKNGELIHAEVNGTSIEFNGKLARMVVIVDKTNEVNAEIARKNTQAKLKEISWIHVHEIRRPLSNILGIAALLDLESCCNQNSLLISKLISQAEELDYVIQKTTKNANID